MNVGMMWFGKGPVDERVKAAAARYERKYGRQATAARVNPAEMPEAKKDENGNEQPVVINGLTVEPMQEILRNHVWVGA